MKIKSPLLLGFDGVELTSELADHFSKINPTGIIFFERNIQSLKQTQKLIRQFKELLGDIIIAIDHEGGNVVRFSKEIPAPPSPRSLFCQKNTQWIETACHLQADILNYLGFNLNFAPVIDLYNPENPVIGTRAFAQNYAEVNHYLSICIKIHEKHQIATTVKHFPGHGHVKIDTHFQEGQINKNLKNLLTTDLIPFTTAIQIGCPAIMTAHLKYPQIDPQNIATLSSKILQKLLRQQLNFQGLIITDCVEMAGIGKKTPAEIAVESIQAGANLIISSYSFQKNLNFQRELHQSLQKISMNITRVQTFIDKYSRLIKSKKMMYSMEDAIQLHLDCLEVKKYRPILCNAPILLVEIILEKKKSGINFAKPQNKIIEIVQSLNNLEKTTQILTTNFTEFECLIQQANQNQQTIVIVTSNLFQNPSAIEIIKKIKHAQSSIHIAIGDEYDLQKNANIEIACRGANYTTGYALKQLFQKEFKEM